MKAIYKIILAFTFVAYIFNFLFPINALAIEEYTLHKENVNPGDDISYIIKRVREKISLVLLSFSPNRKADFYIQLTDVRINELGYIVDKKDIANIQTTSQRYSSAAGELTQYVISKNLTSLKDKIIQKFESHIKTIEKLKKNYDSNSAEWRFLEYDSSYLKTYQQKLQ